MEISFFTLELSMYYSKPSLKVELDDSSPKWANCLQTEWKISGQLCTQWWSASNIILTIWVFCHFLKSQKTCLLTYPFKDRIFPGVDRTKLFTIILMPFQNNLLQQSMLSLPIPKIDCHLPDRIPVD